MMRPRLTLPTLLLLAACETKTMNVGTVPPGSRTAPLSPAARAELEARGAQCTPNGVGPVLCSWSGGGATCNLVFDAADALTELACTVEGLRWTCTHPGDILVCRWSDDADCGSIYSPAGAFEAYLCGQALRDRIDRAQGTDAGVAAHDAGAPCTSPNDPACASDGGPAPTDAAVVRDGGAAPCRGRDERACVSDPSCRADYCPTCTGQSYTGCSAANDPRPTCPAPVCGCNNLDEARCLQNPACRADYCPTCTGRNFVTCAEPNQGPPPCARPICPCTGLDQAACDASTSCHSVFRDPQTCACAPLGCCTMFDHCADGDLADCTGADLACRQVEPHCEGPYVVAYANMCYEGCVRRTECDPAAGVSCTGASGGTFPRFTASCTATPDCDVAIHQINCCGTRHALGINRIERTRFDAAERVCESQYPGCGCADQGIEADDGQFTPDPTHVFVECRNRQCVTFVR